MAKAKVVIRKDRCKGCELCISVCPKHILAIDDTEVNINGRCGIMGPDGAINIYRVE